MPIHYKINPVKTHGLRNVPEYVVWCGIRKRCLDQTADNFSYYGGRGITVCERWKIDFSAFYTDMGQRPAPGFSIDRIDNNGPYEKSNCRWATRKEQANNRRKRSDGDMLEFQGRTQTISQWAEEIGLKKHTLYYRLKRGWPVQRALSL